MKFSVDQKIFEKWPEVQIGVLVLKGINNQGQKDDLLTFLRDEEKKQKKDLTGKELGSLPEVVVWREVYRAFGSNPHDFKSSVEALLKRVQLGKPLPQINKLVDLYNFLSIKYHIPAGAEDLDKVKGDIALTFSDGTDKGKYIGSNIVETCEVGEVVYKDELGFICRRWNWREGDRTKIDEETKNAVLVFEAMPPVDSGDLEQALDKASQLVTKFLGGTITKYLLAEDFPSFEIFFKTGSKVNLGNKTNFEKKEPTKKLEKQIEQKAIRQLPPKDSVVYTLIERIHKAVANTFPQTKVKLENILLEHPEDGGHGDYSTNIALRLTKEFHKSPMEIAGEIVKKIPPSNLIEKVEAVKPGFINIWLSKDYLSRQLNEAMKKKEAFGKNSNGEGKKVIVEYSSPNIAKPFTIAHFRSTIIGDAIANILAFNGFEVLRDNHLGDWGTQFGKMIYAIKTWGNEEEIKKSKSPVKDLVALYVKFHEEVDRETASGQRADLENVEDTGNTKSQGSKLEEEARKWFRRLEQGDKEARRFWKFCFDLSMKEFNRIYDLLNVKFDMMLGESFFEDKMEEIIELAKKSGIAKESRGALVIFYPNNELPPLMLLKSDGGTLYQTRDLATDNYRIKTWGKDILIINEVGVAQSLYFKQIFLAEELSGICKRSQRIHIGHGQMRLPEGSMSTRKGRIVWLEEVINEGISRARAIMDDVTEGEKDLTKQEKEEIAKIVGIGAMKFNDLMQHWKLDVVFDWNKMLNLTGNSGPYIQYTYVRCESVLGKSEADKEGFWSRRVYPAFGGAPQNDGYNDEELSLLRTIYQFPEVVAEAGRNYTPNIICTFLFDLAQKYNNFYNKHSILKADSKTSRDFRLALTRATATVLENGLRLLGIEAPEKM